MNKEKAKGIESGIKDYIRLIEVLLKSHKAIEKYTNQQLTKMRRRIDGQIEHQDERETCVEFASWILDEGYWPHPTRPHRWAKVSDNGWDTFTENQLYKKFKETEDESDENI